MEQRQIMEQKEKLKGGSEYKYDESASGQVLRWLRQCYWGVLHWRDVNLVTNGAVCPSSLFSVFLSFCLSAFLPFYLSAFRSFVRSFASSVMLFSFALVLKARVAVLGARS